jgi:hypothetical protein
MHVTHVTPWSVARRASQSDLLIDDGNIRGRLENCWPFSDMFTSQSADTSESGIDRLKGDRSAVRSAGSTDRDVSARAGRNRLW